MAAEKGRGFYDEASELAAKAKRVSENTAEDIKEKVKTMTHESAFKRDDRDEYEQQTSKLEEDVDNKYQYYQNLKGKIRDPIMEDKSFS